MNIVFIDQEQRANLLPLTYTRPTALLRCGIVTLQEKWQFYLKGSFSYLTERSLEKQFPLEIDHDNWVINPLVMPTKTIVSAIEQLNKNSVLLKNGRFIAARVEKEVLKCWSPSQKPKLKEEDFIEAIDEIQFPWHIFQLNKLQIQHDFHFLTKGKVSAEAHESSKLIGDAIFIEAGAQLINCSLNSLEGPIYIGKNAQVQDGAFIKGPFALCEGATVNMGAKIRDATTVGPYCKVGGEINNSILFGYSNKGHDGFLGNSVLGEWCNLGADTNTSNLKNNYSNVRVHHIASGQSIDTGSQFCGLIMGDHSKSGINTMFNTGTVVGVSANIYGGDFPPKYIPSFSWGGSAGFVEFDFNKALDVAEKVMKRRNKALNKAEEAILQDIFNSTQKDRI